MSHKQVLVDCQMRFIQRVQVFILFDKGHSDNEWSRFVFFELLFISFDFQKQTSVGRYFEFLQSQVGLSPKSLQFSFSRRIEHPQPHILFIHIKWNPK